MSACMVLFMFLSCSYASLQKLSLKIDFICYERNFEIATLKGNLSIWTNETKEWCIIFIVDSVNLFSVYWLQFYFLILLFSSPFSPPIFPKPMNNLPNILMNSMNSLAIPLPSFFFFFRELYREFLIYVYRAPITCKIRTIVSQPFFPSSSSPCIYFHNRIRTTAGNCSSAECNLHLAQSLETSLKRHRQSNQILQHLSIYLSGMDLLLY